MFHSYCIIHQNSKTRDKYIKDQISQLNIHQVDITKIDETTLGIEQVRKIQTSLSRKPFASKHKAVILPADEITPEAQNALLKTLEEPPINTLIYLSLTKLDSLLPTIQSRCFIKYLQMEGTAFTTNEVSEVTSFWEKISKKNVGDRMLETEKQGKDREEIKQWLSKNILVLRQVLLDLYTTDRANPTNFTPKDLKTLLSILIETHQLLDKNINIKLALDHLFIYLPQTKLLSN